MTKTKSQKARARGAQKPSKAKRSAQSARDKAIASKRGMKRPRPGNGSLMLNRRSEPPLSKCAREYKRVLENPFSGNVACVPSAFNTPSLKQSFRAFGTFQTGTNGFGGIVVSPLSTCFNDTNTTVGTDPSTAILYTNSTYTLTTLPAYNSTNAQAASTNSPYSYSSATNATVQFKLVSCGIRVRNVTAQLNRGATTIGIETPQHTDLQQKGISGITLWDQAGLGDSDGRWNVITYHPNDQFELSYFGKGNWINNANIGVDQYYGQPLTHFLGFAVQATTTANTQTYEYEVVTVAEIIGTQVHGLSPSPSDPAGLAAVQNTYADARSRKPQVADDSWFNSHNVLMGAGAMAASVFGGNRVRIGYNNRHQL